MADEQRTIQVDFFLNMARTIKELEEAEGHAKRLEAIITKLSKSGAEIDKGMRRELESMRRGFGDATLTAEVFIINVNRAAAELRGLAATSNRSLDAVINAFKIAESEAKRFSSLEIAAAIERIQREADPLRAKLTAAFADPEKAAVMLRSGVDEVKARMLEFHQASGMALKDIERGFKASAQLTKEFRIADITKAAAELAEAAKEAERALTAAFSTPEREATEFRKNVELIKQEMKILRNEGKLALKDIEQGFKNSIAKTKEFKLNEVTTAARELKEEAKELEQLLNRLFASPGREAQRFRTNVNTIKDRVRELQRVSRLTLDDIEKGFRRANAASKEFKPDAITQAFRELKDETTETEDSFLNLGNVASFVFGSVLGVTAVSVVRRLIDLMREASEETIKFSNALFGIEIAARALQRVGLDVEIEDLNRIVQEIKEVFPIFSDREIREVVGQVALFTRNFGFSFEQMQETIRVTAIIAELEGTRLTDAFDRIRTGLGSGRFQGIRNLRAGLNIDETTLAFEAMAQGINKTIDELTRAERAQLTLSILTRQTGAVQEDAGAIVETLTGQQQAYNAEVDNTRNRLGTLIQFFVQPFRGIAILILPEIQKVLVGVTALAIDVFAVLVGTTSAMITRVVDDWQRLGQFLETGELREGINVFEQFTRAFTAFRDAVRDDVFGQTLGDLPEDERGLQNLFGYDLDELEDESEGVLDKVAKIFSNFNSRMLDLATDLSRKLADIELKRTQKIEDETRKNLLAREKINRQFDQKLSDARIKFQEKELKAEEDFQEKLLNLRNKFLFDLEEALRERDAKQVLRLIKRFNLQNQELQKGEALDREQRRRQFDQELADIEKQRQRRLSEQQLEFEERLRQIDVQNARERQNAIKNYQRRRADLIRQRDERLAILREELEERQRLILDYALREMQLLTRIQQIQRQLFQNNFEEMMERMPGSRQERPGPKSVTLEASRFAEGGTLVANRPTLALFGEVPEIVRFSPIGRRGANEGRVFGGSLPGGTGRDRIDLMVSLSQGLEANIVDRTMNGIANIIVEQV